MGIDLRLIPLHSPIKPGRDFYESTFVLAVERRTALWDAIRQIQREHGQAIPGEFFSHYPDSRTGEGYGLTTEDSYGAPVRYVLAGHLKPLASRPEVSGDVINRAIWAFIWKLPDDWPIVMYWC